MEKSLSLSVRNGSPYLRQDFKGRAVNQLWLEVPKFLPVKNNCLGYKSLAPPAPPVTSCVNQFDLRVQDFRKFRRELAGRLLIKRDPARHGGIRRHHGGAGGPAFSLFEFRRRGSPEESDRARDSRNDCSLFIHPAIPFRAISLCASWRRRKGNLHASQRG